tara:strand:- start:2796 stop:3722 length:927 start_codon:yes stop_codon:yes gene_type:complete
MNKIIAVQSDGLKKINPETDTSLQLAIEAQKRGYKIFWYEPNNLSIVNSKLKAQGSLVKFYENKRNFYKINKNIKFDISKAAFTLIRQNPPFNMNYINSTYFLDNIDHKKVINNPSAIRNVSEKFYSSKFLKFMPATIFTNSILDIYNHYKKYKKIVLKPLDGYAGKNIMFLTEKFSKSKVSLFVKKYNYLMVQKYLNKVKFGDKRIFIINGKVKGAIRRIPKTGSNLSNISQGGTAFKTNLNKRELKISSLIGKSLLKDKIYFAGIDLIDGYLIGDINVTSPTGLPQFKDLTGKNLAKDFWNGLGLK